MAQATRDALRTQKSTAAVPTRWEVDQVGFGAGGAHGAHQRPALKDAKWMECRVHAAPWVGLTRPKPRTGAELGSTAAPLRPKASDPGLKKAENPLPDSLPALGWL